MQAFLIIIMYLGASLFAAGLVAQPLYLPIAAAWPDASLDHVLIRTAMLIALLGSPALLRMLRIDNRTELGLGLPLRDLARQLACGLPVGVAMLIPIVVLLCGLGARIVTEQQDLSLPALLAVPLEGLLAGIAVGLIEETFFRGVVFAAVAKRRGVLTAALLSSLLYASLHFVDAESAHVPLTLPWYGGLMTLVDSVKPFLTPAVFMDSWLALFAAGIFLSLVRIQTGNIALCIGIHAGWVLTLTLNRYLTDTNPASHFSFLIGRYDGVTGYLALAWLVLLGVVYYYLAIRPGYPRWPSARGAATIETDAQSVVVRKR